MGGSSSDCVLGAERPGPPDGPGAAAPHPSNPDDIRAAGWMVAVHNDYRLNGRPYTFWLFTKADEVDDPGYRLTGNGHGRYARGEGHSDAEALNTVRVMIGLPLRCALAGARAG